MAGLTSSTVCLMETPGPREHGADAPTSAVSEKLPPASPPPSASREAKRNLVAEMMAVQDLISKVTKMKPTNLMWDGKPDSLQTFLFIFGEFIEVKCGEAAAGVLRGEMSDADGDPLIAPCVYATWSKELYLMLMGCTEKNSTEAQAATESAIAARETIGRSAFNLIMHWQSLGLATTKRDCDAIDLKITALEIAVNDERATIEVKCARAQQLLSLIHI